MKLIAFILPVYLLILSLIPCCAFDSCPGDSLGKTAAHESGDGDCGRCAPFFSCSACGEFALSVIVPKYDLFQPVSGPQVSGYILNSLPEIHRASWKPPKSV